MANIGANIRRKREELGLSQEELANRVGYKSKSAINKIEQGVNEVRQNKIVDFANALDTTPSVLMGWVDEPTSKKNDDMVVIVHRMRQDEKFLSIVKKLNDLDDEKLELVEKMMSAFR
jgi:transcriptional regulator with XRE-family HTH domain